jgi:hypothetical protein
MPLKYQLKFYADTPRGNRNKLFSYGVHHGQHACNLLARFLAKGFKLRSSFLGRPGTRGDRIPKIIQQFPASIASAGRLLIAYPG